MSDLLFYLVLAILLASLVAYVAGRHAAARVLTDSDPTGRSTPAYHGSYLAICVAAPALGLVLAWLLLQGSVIDALLLRALPEALIAGTSAAQRTVLLSEIRNLAAGQVVGTPSPDVIAAAARLASWQAIARIALVVVVLAAMVAGAAIARSRLAPRFRARIRVERAMSVLMIVCSLAAILVTLGIVASLLFEAVAFFRLVPPQEFLLGLRWEPQMAIRADQVAGPGVFGAVPVFAGTLMIAGIAMLVATPIGLYTAIYLAEYASERTRRLLTPMFEILAAVPTVVYGFFAVLTVTPALRSAGATLGLSVSPNSALAAGMVTGIMIIPLVASLADDALRAVPRSIRDGSLALGATQAETLSKVLLPAAMPGILAGLLLALSRAVGETMIVLMAAGLAASLTINPLDPVTTVTVQIVTLLVGDTDFDSPTTLAAFALGFGLFCATLLLNLVALRIVRHRRQDQA